MLDQEHGSVETARGAFGKRRWAALGIGSGLRLCRARSKPARKDDTERHCFDNTIQLRVPAALDDRGRGPCRTPQSLRRLRAGRPRNFLALFPAAALRRRSPEPRPAPPPSRRRARRSPLSRRAGLDRHAPRDPVFGRSLAQRRAVRRRRNSPGAVDALLAARRRGYRLELSARNRYRSRRRSWAAPLARYLRARDSRRRHPDARSVARQGDVRHQSALPVAQENDPSPLVPRRAFPHIPCGVRGGPADLG